MTPNPKKKRFGGLSGGADAESAGPTTADDMPEKNVRYGQADMNPDPYERSLITDALGTHGGLDINKPVMDPKQSVESAVAPRRPRWAQTVFHPKKGRNASTAKVK